VHGVVRNHACVLASRQIQRPQFNHGIGYRLRIAGRQFDRKADDAPAEDFRPLLELGLDTERVLAGLPEHLQMIARCLAEMPISAVRRKTGLSLAQVNRRIRQMRAAFTRRASHQRMGEVPDDECPTDSDSIHRD